MKLFSALFSKYRKGKIFKMNSVDDILYAPVKPKLFDVYYDGSRSAYSTGPLPYEEAVRLLDHLIKSNGAGYTLHELE